MEVPYQPQASEDLHSPCFSDCGLELLGRPRIHPADERVRAQFVPSAASKAATRTCSLGARHLRACVASHFMSQWPVACATYFLSRDCFWGTHFAGPAE